MRGGRGGTPGLARRGVSSTRPALALSPARKAPSNARAMRRAPDTSHWGLTGTVTLLSAPGDTRGPPRPHSLPKGLSSVSRAVGRVPSLGCPVRRWPVLEPTVGRRVRSVPLGDGGAGGSGPGACRPWLSAPASGGWRERLGPRAQSQRAPSVGGQKPARSAQFRPRKPRSTRPARPPGRVGTAGRLSGRSVPRPALWLPGGSPPGADKIEGCQGRCRQRPRQHAPSDKRGFRKVLTWPPRLTRSSPKPPAR